MLFLIIFILCIIAGFLFPWWVIAIIAFSAALYWGKTSGKSFWSGFLGVAVAWAILALIKSIPNGSILAGRVAILFHLPGWIWIVLVTAIIGGLVGGMAALTGQLFAKPFVKAEKRQPG